MSACEQSFHVDSMHSRTLGSDRKQMLLLASPSASSQFEQLDAKTITHTSSRPQPLGVNDTKMSDNEAFLAYTQSNQDDD
jgi:hypothetical protein